MIGTVLSHYRVLDELGAGGMGVVYRARDDRLQRDVALKVLPPGLITDPDARRRFRHEALALSRLNHPGVATVFDFDTQDGTDFIVMELVEGETLERRLASGALPEKEVLGLGLQIAEALEAAHEQSVIHRDLKPGNIVVTPRARVKVLDFGLARLLQPAVDEHGLTRSHTGVETVVGTLPYMAPELLLGTGADARADLYALGVVLYEMATGQAPFRNALPTALVHEITTAMPTPPGRLRFDLAPRLEDLILRCLEKDPGRRFPSARDVAVELMQIAASVSPGTPVPGLGAPATAQRISSLVVLPLENLSRDPEQEYFADGMTDALIADLAQIAALRVISRTSAMLYKGVRKPLGEIARELGVDAVVEGTVVRAGDRVRITAQLIEAATDRHLWARSYQRDVSDVLALQGEVANAIANEIRIQLTPSEQARFTVPRVVDPRAYEAYLKGRHHWTKRTEEDLRRSIEYFDLAILADPGYALAHAGLADAYNILGDLDAIPPRDAASGAKAAAHRALELDPWLAEPHTSLGFLRFMYEWDWPGAEASFRRALELNSGYATAHQWYAELMMSQGRFDDALGEARRALALDPLAPVMGTTLSDVLYFSRRYDEAIEQLRRNLQMHPQFVQAWNDLGRACAQSGRFEEAFEAFARSSGLPGREPKTSSGLAQAYAMAGRAEEARRMLQRLQDLRRERFVSPHAIAVVHLALGEHDEALRWLEQAYREQDRALVWLGIHPRLDPLRGDARFQELLRRMRLPA